LLAQQQETPDQVVGRGSSAYAYTYTVMARSILALPAIVHVLSSVRCLARLSGTVGCWDGLCVSTAQQQQQQVRFSCPLCE
jgi:hypothetical protein